MLAQLPDHAPFLAIGFLTFSAAWLVATAFWLWMLVDCLRAGRVAGRAKIAWVAVMLCTYIVGALLYLVVVRISRVGVPGGGTTSAGEDGN